MFNIQIVLFAFALGLLLTLAGLALGKATVTQLKDTINAGSYWKNFNRAIEDEIGTQAYVAIKVIIALLLLTTALFNLLTLLMAVVGYVAGLAVATRLYAVGPINSSLNRLVTWINRLRN